MHISNRRAYRIFSLSMLYLLILQSFALQGQSKEQNPFFAMSYGLSELKIEDQVQFLYQAGYEGIGAWVYNETTLVEFRELMATEEVQSGQISVFGVYMPLNRTDTVHRKRISQVLEAGKAQHVPIWLTLRDPNKSDTQELVVTYIQEVCEEASSYGTDVILYPHDRHFAAGVEHTLDIILAAQRDNLFTTLHLNHELRFGNAERLEEVVKIAAPYTRLATLSGANSPENYNRGSRDWGDVVQALSVSQFDVKSFYLLLKKYGYEGPIGYNNFKIPQDVYDHHKETLAIYRSWAGED